METDTADRLKGDKVLKMPDDTGTDNTTDNNSTDTDAKNETPPTGNSPDLSAEVEKWKSLARKHEKAFKDTSKELEGFKAQSMTEQEKAIAEAKQTGMNEAKSLFGAKLVASEIKVGLNGRIDEDSFQKLINRLNVNSFLTDDGDVDTDAVSELVKALIPEDDTKKKSLNLGQGSRGTTSLADDNALERSIMNAVGVRRS